MFSCMWMYWWNNLWVGNCNIIGLNHYILNITYSTVAVFMSWAFRASLRNECPIGSGHSASPAAEQGLCCCLAVFTWAKQMVVSSYLCSYTPRVEKAPFFSWKWLANDYGGRCVTLMTSVALQPAVRQKFILKIQTMCLETARGFPGALWSDLYSNKY